MESPDKICVLKEFSQFIRVLQAYNSANFEKPHTTQFIKNVCFAIMETILILSMPNTAILAAWYLIEQGAPIPKVVVGTPILLSIIPYFVAILAFIIKNRWLIEALNQLQKVVDQRKCCLEDELLFENRNFMSKVLQ